VVEELQLVTADLTQSFDFYARKLGLKLLDRGERWLRFTTGTVALRIELSRTAMDGRRLRRDTYLPVFQTLDIHRSFEVLQARGTTFKVDRPGFSQIGGTARFADPDGQTFCLYQPSAESLTWGSGAKVRAIAGIPM
jgi:catechol 2,3-dioxygenase-like lactoylglutathione lyase family enzyme